MSEQSHITVSSSPASPEVSEAIPSLMHWAGPDGPASPLDIELIPQYIALWHSGDNPHPVSTEVRTFIQDSGNMLQHLFRFERGITGIIDQVSLIRMVGSLILMSNSLSLSWGRRVSRCCV